jgi:hypothetical protein
MKLNVNALKKATLFLCVVCITTLSCSKERTSSATNFSEESLQKSGPIQEELVAGKVQGRWLSLINVCKKKRFKITYKAELFPTGDTLYAYFVSSSGSIVAKKTFALVPNVETTVLLFTTGVPATAQKVFLSSHGDITEVSNVSCGERPATTPNYEDAYVTTYDCIEICE